MVSTPSRRKVTQMVAANLLAEGTWRRVDDSRSAGADVERTAEAAIGNDDIITTRMDNQLSSSSHLPSL